MSWATATRESNLFLRWSTTFLLHFAPAVALAAFSLSVRGTSQTWLIVGAVIVLFLGLIIGWLTRERPESSPVAVVPAAAAAIWLPLAVSDFQSHWIFALSEGILIIGAVSAYSLQTLVATGATRLRLGMRAAQRLQGKTDWPPNLNACRVLREVRELRDAIREEAEPAMPLLSDPRVQVRLSALAALEGRRQWRTGQPDVVMQLARTAQEPEIRTAALLALSNVNQRMMVESLAESFLDSDPFVRRAACQAVFSDCDGRWQWVRAAVREALADPRLISDGPLAVPDGRLSQAAVSDLTAWAMEAGALGTRSTQSLMVYYNRRLEESEDPKLLDQLRELIGNSKASTVLRVELAHLLKRCGHLTPELMLKLIESTNPSPLRLMAVEAILERGPDERALEVLRDVARQPNRELALSAAVVVQKYLQIDLGLVLGESPPPLSSRHASDVTRRVIMWAKKAVVEPVPTSVSSEW